MNIKEKKLRAAYSELIDKYEEIQKQEHRLATKLEKQKEEKEKYKKEYERLLNSRGVSAINKIKTTMGNPYKTKFIKKEEFIEKQKIVEHDYAFDKKIDHLIKDMPVSNGCKYFKRIDVKIGIVCDEFLFNAYKDAADFIFITPQNYEYEINNIDVMIVVSSWRGKNGEWAGLTNPKANNSNVIYEIVIECKLKGIPTIFYSKEDPPSFKQFLHMAKICDYIVTSDENCVSMYEEMCPDVPVTAITFCINPLYHNPIGMLSNSEGVIFSGTWYRKYIKRCNQQKKIFDGVIISRQDFTIINRNYYSTKNSYAYPPEYKKYIMPSVEHAKLQKVHRLYKYAININTITDSNTMFANRVYELQALGNYIISNYSSGMFNRFPNVFIANSRTEIKRLLNRINNDDLYCQRLFGIRKVMTGETCFERLPELLNVAGFGFEKTSRSVCVVADVIDEHIKEMFEIQTYKDKCLIDMSEYNNETHKKHEIIAFFNHNSEYEMFYLEDMINGFKYTDCDYITKDSYYEAGVIADGKEHQYVSQMNNIYRTVFWADSFDSHTLKSFDGPQMIENGYSIDRCHYDALYEQRNDMTNRKYKLSMIIPTYNNGDFLLGKGFAGLLRSSMFKSMEIIIVDDGSTDEYTPNLINYIKKRHSNIKTYFYNDGGSGSASRARNKGVEIATTEYIAFIDPDDEAINDMYARMYKRIDDSNLDFIVSNSCKLSSGKTLHKDIFKYFKKKIPQKHITEIDDKFIEIAGHSKILEELSFMPINIQSMIIRKEFLKKHEIKQVEGAAGEDSLFSKQLIVYAKKFGIFNRECFVYYADRIGSVTNQTAKKFFARYDLIHTQKIAFLKKIGMLDEYMNLRFNDYFTEWYFNKLCSLTNNETSNQEEATKAVYNIYKHYDEYYKRNNKVLNRFISLCEENKYLDAYKFVNNFCNYN